MDGTRVLDWRWMLLLGLALAVGASWMTLRSMGPAFVAAVSWSLATGPGTPVMGARVFRQVLVQDGVLGEALGSTRNGPSSYVGSAVAEDRLDVFVGLGGGALVTVRLHVKERTPWAAVFAAQEAARTLEAWDRRSAATVVASLIPEVNAAIEVVTLQIRIRQVFVPSTSDAAILADLSEREALEGFRDRLLSMSDDVPGGLLRRSGAVSVFLAPGASPVAVAAALLLAVSAGMLVLLLARGVVGAAWSYGVLRSARRVLATVPGAEPDHGKAVRQAIGDIADAILDSRGDASCAIIAFTSPVASAGRTRVACLVAEELARRKRRTLLVDAVLHAPAIADRYRSLPGAIDEAEFGHAASTLEWLERPQERHLITSVQRENAVLDVILQRQPVWLAPGTAGLLFDAARSALECWSMYEVVIIDTSAVDADRGTEWLAPHATGTVIVLTGDRADRAWRKASKTLAHRFGGRVLGVVALLD